MLAYPGQDFHHRSPNRREEPESARGELMKKYPYRLHPNTRDFPNYWMQHSTSAQPWARENQIEIVQGLSAGMPDFGVVQYFSSQPGIFESYDYLIVAFEKSTNQAIGLLAGKWLGKDERRFFYFWTAMVVDRYRKTLLFKRQLQFFFESLLKQENGALPSLIVTKTYNPVVYTILNATFGGIDGINVYPDVQREPQDTSIRSLAENIMTSISDKLHFDSETGVVTGGQSAVAPDFFPYMDTSRDDAANKHFRKNLTPSDQILCIVQISENAMPAATSRLIKGSAR